MDLSLLWSAGHPVQAAALIVPHPGRTGLLLSTVPRDPAHVQAVAETVRAAVHGIVGMGIGMVQALTSPHESLRASALRAAGLRHLATLEYLERPIPGRPAPAPELPAGMRIVTWDPADRRGMTQLLRRTYEGTLDCPGLSDLRRDEDILDGHLGAGTFDPALWFVLREHDRPIGALLLSPSPPTDSVEVIYLGLAPEARGRGAGAALMAHGIRAVANRPERTLALAVDVRNVPATRLYQRFGFAPVRRREAWIAVPGQAQSGETATPPVK
jgi:ribosomal protein S18 acetylase RimI-like enzyme